MTTPQTTFDPPADHRLILADGTINPAWVTWFDLVGRALERLREAATAMDDLDPGVTTLTQITTAWEELRGDLQEII